MDEARLQGLLADVREGRVDIDNGFGAGFMAELINRTPAPRADVAVAQDAGALASDVRSLCWRRP